MDIAISGTKCVRCGQEIDPASPLGHTCIAFGAQPFSVAASLLGATTFRLAPAPEPVVIVFEDGRVEWKEGLTIDQKLAALAQMALGRIPRIAGGA